ncbi:pyrroline-5-carboxylate reductase [Labedella phragmitis]|uniref:Pyrroline-5-carboxylate reductase n=1 Tax=Labedella phragmitis TaxID=2498849 RepID=A0A3S4DP92_9MICO|nr:pyrroline-5-carboxylate reductase [Labedella phragmitis]RWZ52983.1 pyrroline-5-carboxylate reductase [Labedella phragmitis]
MTVAEAPALAVVGAGSLARTLLAGWRRSGVPFPAVTTVSLTAARAAELRADGVTALSVEEDPDAAASAAAAARVVVIAVKPWMVDDVLPAVGAALQPGTIVVSVLAGVRLARLRDLLGTVDVVRVLPNTPSHVNAGFAGIVAGGADASLVGIVRELFAELGDVMDVDEDGLDALTVLSGSGPAFAFLLAEKLAAAAEHQGFGPHDAERIARAVLVGAGALLADSRSSPAELRRRITSLRGVTHHAVEVFEDRDLGSIVIDAADAGLARARELASAPADPVGTTS